MTPNGRAAIADDAITVTTATRSEAEVREGLGIDAKKVDTPAGTVVPGADDKAKPVAGVVTAEQEADSDKPDAALSEAGRTLRGSRADARKAKIQDEINALTRQREEARTAFTREEAERASKRTPPTERKPADAAPPIADGKDSAAKTFTFPTFDQWQVDHPDGDWIQYGDERADARESFRAEQRQVTERAQAEERQIAEAFTRADQHQKSFKDTHPDYDAKLASMDLQKYGVVIEDGKIMQAPHQFIGLQRLLLRAGEAGPGILYYLADHPEDVARLLDKTTTPGDLLETFGEIKYAARASATATPKPAGEPPPAAKPAAVAAEPVAKPRTSAPAPMAAVPGDSSVSKSLADLADDGDDADAYIAVRQPSLLKRAERR